MLPQPGPPPPPEAETEKRAGVGMGVCGGDAEGSRTAEDRGLLVEQPPPPSSSFPAKSQRPTLAAGPVQGEHPCFSLREDPQNIPETKSYPAEQS